MAERRRSPSAKSPIAMATADRPSGQAGSGERALPPPTRLTTAGDVAKFTGLVALFAIFADAAVGHAVVWENDLYCTYWVTKTFLIATIFGSGTAWLGIGIGRGAVITAVHGVVLTVYYWSLSPIGLPSHSEWLDLEHTWGSGVPVHFGVIYLGYLASLWLWRRRERLRAEDPASGPSELSRYAATALGVGIGEVSRIAARDGDREALQAAVADAVTGYVGMNLLGRGGGGLGALTAPTVVVEAEPATSQPPEALSPHGAAALERALELARIEVAALVDEQRGTRRPSTHTREKANATP